VSRLQAFGIQTKGRGGDQFVIKALQDAKTNLGSQPQGTENQQALDAAVQAIQASK
jgi:hypothetical protein